MMIRCVDRLCVSPLVLALSGLLCGLATGCVGPTQVDGRSDGMLFPALRTHVEFGRQRDDGETRRARALVGMEIELSGGSGDFRPTDPAFAKADFDLVDMHVVFRGGVDIDDRLRIEGLAGFEFSRFEIDFGAVNQPRESETANSFGPMIGAQMTLDLVDRLEMFGRATTGTGLGDSLNEKLEVGLHLEISPQTRLLLAHRWWNYENDHLNFALVPNVDLDLDMTGLIIGLDVVF
jgi:hypothetical protein